MVYWLNESQLMIEGNKIGQDTAVEVDHQDEAENLHPDPDQDSDESAYDEVALITDIGPENFNQLTEHYNDLLDLKLRAELAALAGLGNIAAVAVTGNNILLDLYMDKLDHLTVVNFSMFIISGFVAALAFKDFRKRLTEIVHRSVKSLNDEMRMNWPSKEDDVTSQDLSDTDRMSSEDYQI